MRVVLVSIALLASVTLCIMLLAAAAVIGADPASLLGVAAALLMAAILFAALSAIGPKYRPTPFLTPVMAGTMAAFVVTGLALAHGQGEARPDTAIAANSEPVPVPQTQPEPELPAPAPTFAAAPAELSLFSQLSAATEAALSETILPASAEPLQATAIPDANAPIPRARPADMEWLPPNMASAPAPAFSLIPPRPRSRPCGAGGPPCP